MGLTRHIALVRGVKFRKEETITEEGGSCSGFTGTEDCKFCPHCGKKLWWKYSEVKNLNKLDYSEDTWHRTLPSKVPGKTPWSVLVSEYSEFIYVGEIILDEYVDDVADRRVDIHQTRLTQVEEEEIVSTVKELLDWELVDYGTFICVWYN